MASGTARRRRASGGSLGRAGGGAGRASRGCEAGLDGPHCSLLLSPSLSLSRISLCVSLLRSLALPAVRFGPGLCGHGCSGEGWQDDVVGQPSVMRLAIGRGARGGAAFERLNVGPCRRSGASGPRADAFCKARVRHGAPPLNRGRYKDTSETHARGDAIANLLPRTGTLLSHLPSSSPTRPRPTGRFPLPSPESYQGHRFSRAAGPRRLALPRRPRARTRVRAVAMGRP